MVKRLIEFKLKVEEFIFEHASLLHSCFVFLAVFCYLLGPHTTLLRDIVFIISFILMDDLSYFCGIKLMAEYLVQHPEELEDENNR